MKYLALLLLILPQLAYAEDSPATFFVSATPTVDTSAYASGDLIGGKLTFTAALLKRTGTGYVVSVRVDDLAAQAQDLELVIFSEDPSSTTFTDQAAFDLADADISKVAAVVSLGSSSRFAWNDNGVKYLGSLMLPVWGRESDAVSRTLYGALVSRGTPTFATAADVTVTLGLSQD